MKLTLSLLGSSDPSDILNITGFLTNDRDIILTQEAERDAFERVVDDVTIILSNMNNRMTDVILSQSPSAQWQLTIEDSPLVWVGRVEPPMKFTLKNEMLEFTAFSLSRIFWDLCKASTMKQDFTGFYDTKGTYSAATLRGILEVYLEGYARPCRDLGLSVYTDPLFTDRPVGRDGEYSLDESMTIEEFLVGLAHYYNAQFYIDAETMTLKMVQRVMPIHSYDTNLDLILLDDQDPELNDSDLKKYDYAEINLNLPTPTRPSYAIFNTKTSGGFVNVVVSYLCTFVISDGSFEYESAISPQSNRVLVTDNNEGLKGANVTVPTGTSGVTKRNIYREGLDGHFHLVGSINNNTDSNFVDTMSSGDLLERPYVNVNRTPTGIMWSRYDEEGGSWEAPIIEYKGRQGKPTGTIYQISVPWKFIKLSDGSSAMGDQLALRYFGNEIDFNTFSQQWREIFISRRRLKCAVKGTGFRYGQTFVTNRIPTGGVNKRLFAVNVKNVINRERTNLELVTI